jgi:hypothetical protein
MLSINLVYITTELSKLSLLLLAVKFGYSNRQFTALHLYFLYLKSFLSQAEEHNTAVKLRSRTLTVNKENNLKI